MTDTKACSRCGKTKPVSEFLRKNKNVVMARCQACHLMDREWQLANKQKRSEYQRAWHQNNRVDRSQYNRLYYLSHREEALAKRREYYREHSDVASEYYRAYLRDNRDRIYANGRKRRAIKAGSAGQHSARDVEEILRSQRNRCAYCKIRLGKKYHVDHIIPLALGGCNSRRNIQALCAPCNLKKHAKRPEKFAREIGLLI